MSMPIFKTNFVFCFWSLFVAVGSIQFLNFLNGNQHAFEGYWFSPKYRYGFNIKGSVGTSFISNSPTFKPPGSAILKLRNIGSEGFAGAQVFSDGSVVGVTGVTVERDTTGRPSRILMASNIRGQVQTWEMVKGEKGALLRRCLSDPECKAIDGSELNRVVSGEATQINDPILIANYLLMKAKSGCDSGEAEENEEDTNSTSPNGSVNIPGVRLYKEELDTRQMNINGFNFTAAVLNNTEPIFQSWVVGYFKAPSSSCRVAPSFSTLRPAAFSVTCCSGDNSSAIGSIMHFCNQCFPGQVFYAFDVVEC